jgi:hypothetical protein
VSGKLGKALTRKLGPLPAWAWALVLIGGLLAYRRFKGQQSPLISNTSQAVTPSEPAAKRDPLVLSPGESVYDPETGKLIGPGGLALPPPGENPGDVPGDVPAPVGPPATGDAPAPLRMATPSRRTPKPRVARPAPVRTPRAGAGSRTSARIAARGAGALRRVAGHGARTAAQGPRVAAKRPTAAHVVRAAHAASERTSRGTVKAPTRAADFGHTPRARPSVPILEPTVRQRPEPPRLVDHTTQKVVKKPAPAPARPGRRRVA